MKDDQKYQTVYIDNAEEEDEVNLREVFEKYSYHYKWFLLGLVLALLLAFTYLRYTPSQYEENVSILIDDKENGGGLNSELSAFSDLGLLGDNKKSLDTEMSVLKSRTLMQRVVKELGINVTYFTVGRIRSSEIYKQEVPFKINFLVADSVMHQLDTSFTISGRSSTNYELSDVNGNLIGSHDFGERCPQILGP